MERSIREYIRLWVTGQDWHTECTSTEHLWLKGRRIQLPYLLMASKWIYFVKPLLAPSFSPLRAVKIMLVMEQLKGSDIWKILALRLILKYNFWPGPQSPGLGSSRLEQGLLNIKVTKEIKFCFSSKFRLTTHCWLVSIEMREMWVFWQRNLRIPLKQCLFRKTVSVSCPSGVAENSSCCCRWHCCNSVLTFHVVYVCFGQMISPRLLI